jgi:hypothetical protein
MAMRVQVIVNPADKELMEQALRYLVEHQIITSRGIKDEGLI